jgi:SAM-dependent methyltransferase
LKIAYSTDWFQGQRHASLTSARQVVPVVLDFVQPKTVIDVGCGIGTWLSVFREHGIDDIWGLDGDYVNRSLLMIPPERFLAADLARRVNYRGNADLVVSLEVAEHLPPRAADTFVETLTTLGPIIMFSAAIPFQGGSNHLNERWPDYWADKFLQRGYCIIDCLRRRLWQNKLVQTCYAQNSFFFVRSDYIHSQPLLKDLYESESAQLSVIHPNLYLERADPEKMCFRKALSLLAHVTKHRLRARFSAESHS